MRSTLIAILLAASAWVPASAEETTAMDWMAILVVAGQKCPGHSYDTNGLAAIASNEAKALGWSEAKIEREAEARTVAEFKDYSADPQLFCIVADMGRRQYLTELKKAGALR